MGSKTHVYDCACTETGASVEPVVGLELVDLDSLPLVCIHCRGGRFRAGPVWAADASGLSTAWFSPCRAGRFEVEMVERGCGCGSSRSVAI